MRYSCSSKARVPKWSQPGVAFRVPYVVVQVVQIFNLFIHRFSPQRNGTNSILNQEVLSIHKTA